MTINQKNRKIYYMPVTVGDFDYGLVNMTISEYKLKNRIAQIKRKAQMHIMVTYDLITGKREDLGHFES